MMPIYFTAGTERYVLVRRGTKRVGEALPAARARAVFEALLRRGDPQLLLDLARALRIDEDDPEELVSLLLARLAEGSLLGPTLELRRISMARPVYKLEQPAAEQQAEEEEEEVIEAEPPEEEDEEELEQTTIRISVFFDGTNNNRANTRKQNEGKKEGDFESAETNISRLEMMCEHDPSFEHHDAIYVEGIGTRDGWWNDPIGLAAGMGFRGVKAKVERGAKLLLQMIDGFSIEPDTIITELQVDSFGFSRGAAAARHFIHYILEEDPIKAKIEALGLTVEKVQVNFVGIYDTVASVGIDHDDDSDQLRMDAVTKALQVVHLAAAEEYRANFRLTNIASMGQAGTELFLPGVHSDVGGGYTPLSSEKDLEVLDIKFKSGAKQRLQREIQWLVEETGWYTADQVQEPDWLSQLRVDRERIYGSYNRIPLKLMADFAAESGLTWGPIEIRFPVPAQLDWIHKELFEYASQHRSGRSSSAADWTARRDQKYKQLRNKYLHFSSHYNGTGVKPHKPQWDSRGVMEGERKRIIQTDVPSGG